MSAMKRSGSTLGIKINKSETEEFKQAIKDAGTSNSEYIRVAMAFGLRKLLSNPDNLTHNGVHDVGPRKNGYTLRYDLKQSEFLKETAVRLGVSVSKLLETATIYGYTDAIKYIKTIDNRRKTCDTVTTQFNDKDNEDIKNEAKKLNVNANAFVKTAIRFGLTYAEEHYEDVKKPKTKEQELLQNISLSEDETDSFSTVLLPKSRQIVQNLATGQDVSLIRMSSLLALLGKDEATNLFNGCEGNTPNKSGVNTNPIFSTKDMDELFQAIDGHASFSRFMKNNSGNIEFPLSAKNTKKSVKPDVKNYDHLKNLFKR